MGWETGLDQSGFCADADGSGNFSNWQKAGHPSHCNGQQWYMANTAAMVELVAAAQGGGSGGAQFTAQEVAALKYQAANPSPWAFSVADGVQLSGAIVLTWALAWVFRVAASTLWASRKDSED